MKIALSQVRKGPARHARDSNMLGDRERTIQMAGVSRLLPTFAHELSNSVTAMSCLVEVMLRQPNANQTTADLRAMRTVINAMKTHVSELAVLGETQNAKGQLTDIVRTAHHCVNLLRPAANISATRVIYAGLEQAFVRCAPARVHSILLNLLTNSLQACEQGGSVHVVVQCSNKMVEVEIRDTGCGMSEDVLARSCEPYFTTRPDGHGIGLAYVRDVIEDANGSFSVESAPGVGTRVRVVLHGR